MTDTTEHPLPTNAYELADFLRAFDAKTSKTNEDHKALDAMYGRLDAEYGREEAARMIDAACTDIDHDTNIDEATAELTESLVAAQAALHRAALAVVRLTDGNAWHVEYAETGAGGDITAHLEIAARATRAALAINRQAAGS